MLTPPGLVMADNLIKKFPDEVLFHIFSHLDPLGKVTASSVCKHWMKIINDSPDLLDNVCVRFKGFEQQDRGLEVFLTMIRNFCCFWFDNVNIDLNIFQFLKKNALKFRSLSFGNSKVTIDLTDPSHKISNLDNLLELRILFSPVHGIFTNLKKLKSLHISITNKFVERDLPHIVRLAPISLTELKIDSVCPVSHIRFMSRVFLALKSFIDERRSTLRCLEITGLPILDQDMALILKIEGLRLKRLKLPRYFSREKTFQTLCTSQRGIVALNVENVYLDDHIIVMICNALPQMEELNVSQCALSNRSVTEILKLKCLRKLDLSGSMDMTHESFHIALGKLACIKLNILHLKYVNIEHSILSSILSLLPNLRKITLNKGYNLDSRWVKCFKNVPHNTQTFLYRPNL